MTTENKIKYILRKHKHTRYNRADFMIAYLQEFYGVYLYITFSQFREFWADEPTIERKLRDILREPEFKPKPEQDAQRYKKASEFQQRLSPQDKKDFKKVFN